jgi:hypothetical protein
MAREKFELVAGHIIIEQDRKRFLLDTGSPISFGSVGMVRLFGNTVALMPNAPPLDAAAIGRQVGDLAEPPVDLELGALLGTNLLRGLAMTIDWRARTITTRSARAEIVGWRGDGIGGLPLVQVSINGRTVTGVPDTGARSCFAVPRLLAGAPVVGTSRDFYPGLGSFEATVHSVQVQLDGVTETIGVAAAPPLVEQAMGLAGADALIGTDLMVRRGSTTFVFAQPARTR